MGRARVGRVGGVAVGGRVHVRLARARRTRRLVRYRAPFAVCKYIRKVTFMLIYVTEYKMSQYENITVINIYIGLHYINVKIYLCVCVCYLYAESAEIG